LNQAKTLSQKGNRVAQIERRGKKLQRAPSASPASTIPILKSSRLANKTNQLSRSTKSFPDELKKVRNKKENNENDFHSPWLLSQSLKTTESNTKQVHQSADLAV
jgi:hypothetical protein